MLLGPSGVRQGKHTVAKETIFHREKYPGFLED